MPINTDVTVTTGDAAPAAPPFRISANAGHDAATIEVHAVDQQGVGTDALAICLGGVSPDTGTLLDHYGLWPRDDLAPGNQTIMQPRLPVDSTTEFVINAAEVAGADGNKTINVYAGAEGRGWN